MLPADSSQRLRLLQRPYSLSRLVLLKVPQEDPFASHLSDPTKSASIRHCSKSRAQKMACSQE
jgi:hypothetical protein